MNEPRDKYLTKNVGVNHYKLHAGYCGSHTDIWPLMALLWRNVLLKTQDYCLANFSKIPLSNNTKDILVRAKFPKRLLHVDKSCVGLSRTLLLSLSTCDPTISLHKLRYISTSVPENWPILDGFSQNISGPRWLLKLIIGLCRLTVLADKLYPTPVRQT